MLRTGFFSGHSVEKQRQGSATCQSIVDSSDCCSKLTIDVGAVALLRESDTYVDVQHDGGGLLDVQSSDSGSTADAYGSRAVHDDDQLQSFHKRTGNRICS